MILRNLRVTLSRYSDVHQKFNFADLHHRDQKLLEVSPLLSLLLSLFLVNNQRTTVCQYLTNSWILPVFSRYSDSSESRGKRSGLFRWNSRNSRFSGEKKERRTKQRRALSPYFRRQLCAHAAFKFLELRPNLDNGIPLVTASRARVLSAPYS